jgi:hypothetical protein
MPSKHHLMKLSRDEDLFLRHWMYDEVHYQQATGQAKELQLRHRVRPADVAELIAAAIPDPAEQESAGRTPPTSQPSWPWSEDSFRLRLEEARAVLGLRRRASSNATSE